MVNPASSGRHSRFIVDESARQPAAKANSSKQKAFQLQLQRSLAAAGESAPAKESVPKRQAFAETARTRQEVAARNPFQGTGAAIPPEKPTAVSPAAKVNLEAKDPVSVLREAMQKAGIMSNIDLTISDEIVQYPGGAYRNHLIKADFGNGVTESYSVDLMMKNPWLTAFEMKRSMTGAA